MDQLNLVLGIASSVLGILAGVVGLRQMRQATSPGSQRRAPRRKRFLAVAAVTMVTLIALGGWLLARGERTHFSSKPLDGPFARGATSPLEIDLRWLARRDAQSVPSVVTDGTVLKSGAYYALYLRPQRDATVYVFQIDSEFHVDQLFPSADLSIANPLKGGTEHYLPSSNQWYKLDDTQGQEMLIVVGSGSSSEELNTLGYVLKAAIEKDLRAQYLASLATPDSRGNEGVAALPPVPITPGAAAIFERAREVLKTTKAPFIHQTIFWHE